MTRVVPASPALNSVTKKLEANAGSRDGLSISCILGKLNSESIPAHAPLSTLLIAFRTSSVVLGGTRSMPLNTVFFNFLLESENPICFGCIPKCSGALFLFSGTTASTGFSFSFSPFDLSFLDRSDRRILRVVGLAASRAFASSANFFSNSGQHFAFVALW